jgi:hypothetical protein
LEKRRVLHGLLAGALPDRTPGLGRGGWKHGSCWALAAYSTKWTSGGIRAETYGSDLYFWVKKLNEAKIFLTLIALLPFFTRFPAISPVNLLEKWPWIWFIRTFGEKSALPADLYDNPLKPS